jgi:hypothetical protein
MRPPLLGLIALLACCLPSCSTKQHELNLSEYPKLPGSKITRALVSSNGYTRNLALYGNYGGPGCAGGEPVDAMDRLFLEHDLSYLQGVKRRELIESDQLLISQLQALDATGFPPKAEAYRHRAIGYFERPLSRVIGKPPAVLFGWKKRPAVIDTSDRLAGTK